MRIHFKAGNAWKERFAVALILAALTGVIQISRLGDAVANLSYDLLIGIKPATIPGEAVIIYLDEQASSSLLRDSLLWDRAALARLVDALRGDGCRLVVFDIWFFDAGPEGGDKALARAFRDHGGVVIAGVPEEDTGSGTSRGMIRAPNPIFQAAAAGWGVAGVPGQRDAIVRHYHPGTDREPSLSAVAASIWFRGLASTAPRRSEENLWLNYYGAPGVIPGISYSDALVQRPGFYTGKAVFIGVKNKTPFSFGQNDVFRTPLTLWGNGFLPGVDLAATSFLNQIHGEGLKQVPAVVENVLLILVALAFGWWLPSLRPARGFSLACGLGLLWLVVALTLAQSQHIWFSWILPAALQPGLLLGWMLFHARSAPVVTATQTLPVEGATSPRISDHTLLRRVGRGAYGEVWLAQDVIGTFKAVKLIHRSSFESDEPFDREFRGMQTFTPLSRAHPGWVHILHVGKEESYFYYVMELGDDERTGQDIVPESYQPRNLAWDLRQRRRLPLDECIQIGIALADALDYLHSQLLVHRDIKPSNVIYVHGEPKFADIGLVTELRNRDRQVSCLGTVGYMAPEGPGTAAADLYSLAKLLYEISTGHAPLQYPASPESLLAEPGAQRMSLFQAVVDKSCSLDPATRHQSAAELRDALRALM
jgi:CHASE2 domain-containing sensor protein